MAFRICMGWVGWGGGVTTFLRNFKNTMFCQVWFYLLHNLLAAVCSTSPVLHRNGNTSTIRWAEYNSISSFAQLLLRLHTHLLPTATQLCVVARTGRTVDAPITEAGEFLVHQLALAHSPPLKKLGGPRDSEGVCDHCGLCTLTGPGVAPYICVCTCTHTHTHTHTQGPRPLSPHPPQGMFRSRPPRSPCAPPASPLCFTEASTASHGDSSDASSVYSPPVVTAEDFPFLTPPDLWDNTSPLPSPKTPVFSPLPCTPLSSAKAKRLLKRSRTAGPTARQLFQD